MPGRLHYRQVAGKRRLVYRRVDGKYKIGDHRYSQRSPSRDAKVHAKHTSKPGYGHAGDHKRRSKSGWL